MNDMCRSFLFGNRIIRSAIARLGRDDVEDALARFIDIKKHVPIVTLIDG
jgi:hypothetical protein